MKTSTFDPKRLMIAMTVLLFGCSTDITAPVDPSDGDSVPGRSDLQPALTISYPDLAITRMVERTLKGNMKSIEVTVTNKGSALRGSVEVSLGRYELVSGDQSILWVASKKVDVFLASGGSFKVTFLSSSACGLQWIGSVDRVRAWAENSEFNNEYQIVASCP